VNRSTTQGRRLQNTRIEIVTKGGYDQKVKGKQKERPSEKLKKGQRDSRRERALKVLKKYGNAENDCPREPRITQRKKTKAGKNLKDSAI